MSNPVEDINKILEFLECAMVTFGSDASLSDEALVENYIYEWGDTDAAVTLPNSRLLDENGENQATNYAAAFAAADEIWGYKDALNTAAAAADSSFKPAKKVMLFLSDGEPTVAYADGKIHFGFEQDGVPVGSGASSPSAQDDSFVHNVMKVLFAAYTDAKTALTGGDAHTTRNTLYHSTVSGCYKDDVNGVHNVMPWVTLFDDALGSPLFPQESSVLEAEVTDLPGLAAYPDGDFTDPQAYIDWYDSLVGSNAALYSQSTDLKNWLLGGTVQGEETPAHLTGVSVYDIFYLTENAFAQFVKANGDVTTYSVALSSVLENTVYDSTRRADEVMKYMSGSDRFYVCGSEKNLIDVINGIAQLSGVSMHDELSRYVKMADTPDFRITIKRSTDTSPVELYNAASGFTTLGQELLDTAATATYLDADNGKIHVAFKPGVVFNDDMKIKASFAVKLTDKAYDDRTAMGETYDGSKGDYDYQKNAKGEYVLDENGKPIMVPVTDYDAAHVTSSNEYGFYSNVNTAALAQWSRGGEQHRENFPKPVVQVPDPVSIKLKKIDAGGDLGILAGAEFDLYRELPGAKEGCLTYTDGAGTAHYLLKQNTQPLVSAAESPITVSGLRLGKYYLFETKAPVGYSELKEPILFTLTKSAIVTSDTNVTVDTTDTLLMSVKNSSGYELPETGGPGTSAFTLSGLALMSVGCAGACIRLRRRKRHA